MFKKIQEFFSGKKKDKEEFKTEYSVSDLKIKYLLDYDLESWEVQDVVTYNWKNGSVDKEFAIRSGKKTRYLNFVPSANCYSMYEDANLDAINSEFRRYIRSGADLPDRITFDGKEFILVDGGVADVKSSSEEYEMRTWMYEGVNKQDLISINSYGDLSAEAFVGEHIEEHEISNILPR